MDPKRLNGGYSVLNTHDRDSSHSSFTCYHVGRCDPEGPIPPGSEA